MCRHQPTAVFLVQRRYKGMWEVRDCREGRCCRCRNRRWGKWSTTGRGGIQQRPPNRRVESRVRVELLLPDSFENRRQGIYDPLQLHGPHINLTHIFNTRKQKGGYAPQHAQRRLPWSETFLSVRHSSAQRNSQTRLGTCERPMSPVCVCVCMYFMCAKCRYNLKKKR